ncbi:hypothetical protein OSTOST_18108 [Ostertagia ostertagi]
MGKFTGRDMSGLVSCPHCDRLYSHHSLQLHISKCKENPGAIRRFSMVLKKNTSAKNVRPRTRSMSRPAGDSFRLCYVCGQRFDERNIASHEQKCIKDWSQTCDRLTTRFESRTPMPLLIPSVDGTSDARRLNEHATAQATKAQTLRCRRCNTKVPLSAAEQHRCTRFEPPVEFFF